MVIEEIMYQSVVIMALLLAFLLSNRRGRRNRGQMRRFFLIDRIPDQVSNMSRLVTLSDGACRDQLRMDRVSFARLCDLLGTLGSLSNSSTLSYLEIEFLVLSRTSAITDECTDPRWKCFKGCLGALDGTYIDARVPEVDKLRYRNRKG
ncbi:hypothetical protein ACS0TY_003659 [Phlomoides rotata]